ncbi:hypothetical protein IWQ60_001967 [Tieghemiomyces parasiticus]|uniref:Uncharacterized protein n=1 Tax=Tieghemiomyces parasiticus TaxID=78921 RepID=A0A9W8AD65_9FUNG|nr:hypothetical protein IWQ60_001967 [Tieghemiomyces parasiticus]
MFDKHYNAPVPNAGYGTSGMNMPEANPNYQAASSGMTNPMSQGQGAAYHQGNGPVAAGNFNNGNNPMGVHTANTHGARVAPSKAAGYVKEMKGSLNGALGSITGSRSLKVKGYQEKLDGRAEIQAAKANKFNKATAQYQGAGASKVYGGPVNHTTANAQQNYAAMKMNKNM